MIRQIRYFQAVVRCNSFSEAAEECHISQSAISQQVQALERELGFDLLERRNRKFTLTPAGEHFYRKSLVLMADFERMCQESRWLANADRAALTIGYLRCYSGQEFQLALGEFSAKHPDVAVRIEYGNHEELYELLRSGKVDIVLNDQRRAFSDQYANLLLTTGKEFIEISARNPIAALPSVAPQDLKNVSCILVASKEQRENEQEYIVTLADEDKSAAETTLACLRGYADCVNGAKEMGVIVGSGVYEPGTVKQTDAMAQAYRMGRNA